MAEEKPSAEGVCILVGTDLIPDVRIPEGPDLVPDVPVIGRYPRWHDGGGKEELNENVLPSVVDKILGPPGIVEDWRTPQLPDAVGGVTVGSAGNSSSHNRNGDFNDLISRNKISNLESSLASNLASRRSMLKRSFGMPCCNIDPTGLKFKPFPEVYSMFR